MKIMTWNIKGESSLGWNNTYRIDEDKVERILSCNADILVLTAFVATVGFDNLIKSLKEKEYIWFYRTESGDNGIFIAIKESNDDFKLDLKRLQTKIFAKTTPKDSNAIYSQNDGSNILKVVVPLQRGKDIVVLGFRMKTGEKGKSLEEQYDNERIAFERELLPLITNLNQEICIVAGDFNNARCLGDLNQPYNEDDYSGYAQKGYNLNYIKDVFDENGFVMADNSNGRSMATHNKFVPDDHIFLRGFSETKVAKVEEVGNLSDHDIVLVDVKI